MNTQKQRLNTRVTFLFDPSCPWTWITSRWIRLVASARDIDLRWGLLSLEYLNRDNPNDPRRDKRPRVRLALRLLALTDSREGNSVMGRLYERIGEAHHQRGLPLDDEGMLEEALREVQLPLSLLDDAKDMQSLDRELEPIYEDHVKRGAIGVPSIFIGRDDDPFFGPVIDKVPPLEQALELWDLIVSLSRHSYFYELKRAR